MGIMENGIFDNIIGVLSNYFELFICVNACILGCYLIIQISVRLHGVDVVQVMYSTFRGMLMGIIIVGQIVLCFLYGYLYWQNYKRPAPLLQLSSNVYASTHWVKSSLRMYFVDGNVLRSIRVNGRDAEDVFVGNSPVREYHLSPDGSQILVLTQEDLFLVDAKSKSVSRIDTIQVSSPNEQEKGAETKGSITGMAWAPDSRKFVYEIARWSAFAGQDQAYVYFLDEQKKKVIRSPARRVSSLYWHQKSDSLYYLYHEAQDTSVEFSAYEVKVFRIPLATLTPELITRIPYEDDEVPIKNLKIRGIDLFLGGDKILFDRTRYARRAVSERGSVIGIDDQDYLYFINAKWFRKRLFKIPRELRYTDMPRHQYQGGDLVMGHVRWIPGGRYVVMEHRFWGILILEPSTGKIGLLIQAKGHSFGWH